MQMVFYMYLQKIKQLVNLNNIRIEASSGLSDEEIKKMKVKQKLMLKADRKAKEEADKINAADALVFQTEKQLKEFGDKIPADKKQQLNQALQLKGCSC
jgi:molecular chaperone DnaK